MYSTRISTIILLTIILTITAALNVAENPDIVNRTRVLSRNKRVIGGLLTMIEEFPYLVIIGERDAGDVNILCGGSIISSRWIVTAAHCCHDINIRDIIIRSGVSFALKSSSNEKRVIQMIIHEDFSNITAVHDIALLKVNEPFKWNFNHQPIGLFDSHDNITIGMMGQVAGFGLAGSSPHQMKDDYFLRTVKLPIFDRIECEKLYKDYSYQLVTSNTVCAGYYGKSMQKGSCIGDSGGPLEINGRLAGIVSFGKECDKVVRFPSVFTSIPLHRDWIDSYVRISSQICLHY